jgi:hypothetical protein
MKGDTHEEDDRLLRAISDRRNENDGLLKNGIKKLQR